MRMLVAMAWRNMWRNWRRTAIAMVAIVLGVVFLVFMDGLFAGSDQAIFGNAVRLYGGNVQVHAPGYGATANRLPLLPLPDADAVVAAASALPETVSASKRIRTSGLVGGPSAGHTVVITAIEPEAESSDSLIAANVSDGRFLVSEDEDAIVIGRALADSVGVDVGDRLTLLGRGLSGSMHERGMTVVGVYDLGVPDTERRLVLVNLPEAQRLYGLEDQATEVIVTFEKVGREEDLIPRLESALPGYEIDSWETLRPELRQTLDTKETFSSFFGFVVVLIACIGILNILLMAVYERTREMGVLEALGMKGRQVMALFVIEGTLIGLVGALIGILLGLVVVYVVGRIGIDLTYAEGWGEISALMGSRLYPDVTIAQAVARGATVVLMAAVASLYPAWQAARKQPAEVLHHV